MESRHPFIVTIYDRLCLGKCEIGAFFLAQSIQFGFFLQMDLRQVPVVKANPKFFASIDTVDFFAECFVPDIVKVKAADPIDTVNCMRV